MWLANESLELSSAELVVCKTPASSCNRLKIWQNHREKYATKPAVLFVSVGKNSIYDLFTCYWGFPVEHIRENKRLCNYKFNERALIGQSAMVYCDGKPMKKSRVF